MWGVLFYSDPITSASLTGLPPPHEGRDANYATYAEVGFVRGQILAHPSRVRFSVICDLRTKASLTGKRPLRQETREGDLRILPPSRVN